MCLNPVNKSDEADPPISNCKYSVLGKKLTVTLKTLASLGTSFKLRIAPQDLTDDESFIFSIMMTTQKTRTVLTNGIWHSEYGKFSDRMFEYYFSSQALLGSLFIQTMLIDFNATVFLIPFEDLSLTTAAPVASLTGKNEVFTMDQDMINAHCNSSARKMVVSRHPVRRSHRGQYHPQISRPAQRHVR